MACGLKGQPTHLTPYKTGHTPPMSRRHLSLHLHLRLPASSSHLQSRPWPSLFTHLLQAEIQRQSTKPRPQRAISVKPAKISFQNTDLWSTGLLCVNHTPGRPVSTRGCSRACRLCAPYLRIPSPGKSPQGTPLTKPK